jgi:hypothetical protein
VTAAQGSKRLKTAPVSKQHTAAQHAFPQSMESEKLPARKRAAKYKVCAKAGKLVKSGLWRTKTTTGRSESFAFHFSMRIFIFAILVCSSFGRMGIAFGDDLFRSEVAPIFEAHCLGCHSGPKPKGDFSLVAAESALAGGENGKVIEPGKPDESLLIAYISGDKPEMPKDEKPLSAGEVAVVRNWIESGAAWPKGLTLAALDT